MRNLSELPVTRPGF